MIYFTQEFLLNSFLQISAYTADNVQSNTTETILRRPLSYAFPLPDNVFPPRCLYDNLRSVYPILVCDPIYHQPSSIFAVHKLHPPVHPHLDFSSITHLKTPSGMQPPNFCYRLRCPVLPSQRTSRLAHPLSLFLRS